MNSVCPTITGFPGFKSLLLLLLFVGSSHFPGPKVPVGPIGPDPVDSKRRSHSWWGVGVLPWDLSRSHPDRGTSTWTQWSSSVLPVDGKEVCREGPGQGGGVSERPLRLVVGK